MRKKVFRYFFGFLESQEKWLNKMSSKGYRLVKVGKLIYEFEKCEKNKYVYCIDFIGHLSNNESKKYKSFLKELGYRAFSKNINLNFSIGKIRFRPYGKGTGKISTSPGSYNKEILILEKINDNKPFELYTSSEDKIHYYKYLRNSHLSIFMLFFLFSMYNYFSINRFLFSTIILTFIGLTFLFVSIFYQRKILDLKTNDY